MNRSRAALRALVATATGALLFGGGTSAAHADDVPAHVQGWSAELRSMTLIDDTGEAASDEVYITTSNLNGPDRIKMTRKREDFDKGESHTFATGERCIAPIAFLGSPDAIPQRMDAQSGTSWVCDTTAAGANGFRFTLNALESDGSGTGSGIRRHGNDDVIGTKALELNRFQLFALAANVGQSTNVDYVLDNGSGGSVKVTVTYKRVR